MPWVIGILCALVLLVVIVLVVLLLMYIRWGRYIAAMADAQVIAKAYYSLARTNASQVKRAAEEITQTATEIRETTNGNGSGSGIHA